MVFICGIGTANLIMGLAIYYGIATWVSKFLTKIVNAYPLYVYGAAAIGGIVLLGAGIRLIIKTRQSNAEKTIMDVRKPKMSKPLPSFPRYRCLSWEQLLYGRIDERISVFWLFSTIDKLSFDISIGAAIYVDL